MVIGMRYDEWNEDVCIEVRDTSNCETHRRDQSHNCSKARGRKFQTCGEWPGWHACPANVYTSAGRRAGLALPQRPKQGSTTHCHAMPCHTTTVKNESQSHSGTQEATFVHPTRAVCVANSWMNELRGLPLPLSFR